MTGEFQSTASFGETEIALTTAGGYDVFVAKLSSTGDWLWARRAGGSSADRARDIAVNASGDVFVTGYYHSTASFGETALSSAHDRDAFVAKLSPGGDWFWAVRAGGAAHCETYGIALDDSDNVFVSGNFFNTVSVGDTEITSVGGLDVFVAKLSSSGEWW